MLETLVPSDVATWKSLGLVGDVTSAPTPLSGDTHLRKHVGIFSFTCKMKRKPNIINVWMSFALQLRESHWPLTILSNDHDDVVLLVFSPFFLFLAEGVEVLG